jgi:hypothetical protein
MPNGSIRIIAATATVAAALTIGAGEADATRCFRGVGSQVLDRAFAGKVDRLDGADYQRAIALGDGRVLWTLQDAFVDRPGRADRLLHNVAVVEDTNGCFAMLRTGTAADPRPWIGADATQPQQHWFWPLAGVVDREGLVHVFVAEMVERGPRYLTSTEPVATWIATLDPSSLQVQSFTPAPDAGPALYGWSAASDDRFTYLYGHCYRQFGFGFLGHDACTAAVTVARVPLGEVHTTPTYWDGANWTPDAARAVDIAPKVGPDGTGRTINPMQVIHVDGRWLAVTKEGDWWGSRVYLDEAPGPAGPWSTVALTSPRPLGRPKLFNTYFAQLAAGIDGRLVLGISNNRWDGRRTTGYRPTFQDLAAVRWEWIAPGWSAP